MKKSRNQSQRIALCGISIALAVVILAIGHSLTFGEFLWYYAASLLIELPERVVDKFLSFFATSILSLLLCGFNFIYLAAFCLLLGPYALAKASVRPLSPALRYAICTLVSFLGLLAVCWWTPMFWVQLSIVSSPTVRWTALLVISLVSLVFDPLYGWLYLFGKKILSKVWSGLA